MATFSVARPGRYSPAATLARQRVNFRFVMTIRSHDLEAMINEPEIAAGALW